MTIQESLNEIIQLHDAYAAVRYDEHKPLEEKDPVKAKIRILDKVKSFGEDVLSNIVANIITNPTIWNGLF